MEGRRVLLVRHGESTWNADGRWQGQADPPLSEAGAAHARAAASAVAELAPVAVVTSDLARARATAELVAPPGTVLQVDPTWRERLAGEWTGLTRAEIEARFPGWLAEWRSPPGFEDDAALLARVRPALARLLDGTGSGARGGRDGVILVVTHGGVIRTLERDLGAPRAPLPNLGGRFFGCVGGEIVLGARETLVAHEAVQDPEQL
jgi:broad specificity phosphatase PhoE